MTPNRTDGQTHDVLVCADVLGAFGVTPTDVRAQATAEATDWTLERILDTALRTARDRTEAVRQFICASRRGIVCPARYSTTAFETELSETFEAMDWSIELHDRDGGGDGGLQIRATDSAGRHRNATVTYPETPLERDNLPAVLAAINDEVLFGVEARFVLLSDGTERWRAALVETDELATVRERYGDRVRVFDRPLLPEYGIDAYVPANRDDDGTTVEPWPAWSVERMQRSTSNGGDGVNDSSGRSTHGDPPSGSLAETEPVRSRAERKSRTKPTGVSSSTSSGPIIPNAEEVRVTTRDATGDGVTDGDETGEDEYEGDETEDEPTETRNTNDFEIVGGSPTVSRVSDRGDDDRRSRDQGGRATTDEHEGGSKPAADSRSDGSVDRNGDRNRTHRSAGASRRGDRETNTDEFGTLSGRMTTSRVSNDSFGADVETPTDDDRYRAFGAAIDTGRDVSVKGLLDDDEFLPEVPAVDPIETRIEFEEEFDPSAVSKARATAEESGYEWVASGSIETKRISNE